VGAFFVPTLQVLNHLDPLFIKKSPEVLTMKYLGFISSSLSFIVLFAASASPIQLYDLYRRADGLSYSDLSLTAVVYFIGAITALLFMGRISNHLGRKPITLTSYLLTALACLILMKVDSATPLIVGRLLLGHLPVDWLPVL